jgi:dTDP-4-amino-4,6-dideoxygalactose transaminase
VPGGRRDALRQALTERGIGTGVHYPVPVHLQEACEFLGYRRGDLPVTERLADEVLSLPIYAELTDAEVEIVAAEVKECLVASAV